MRKYLVVTHIPKDEEILKEVLKALGDHTWSDEGLKGWMSNLDTSSIYYCKKYDSYFAGTGTTLPITTKHRIVNYWQVIKEVKI